MLDVPSLSPTQGLHRLLRCSGCASVFYECQDILDFSDLGHAGSDFWRSYVEVQAGIWEMIWPIAVVRGVAPRRLLEVGCGFGFSLDFWQRSQLGAACGVEVAAYGSRGRDMLGVEVFPYYLEACPELAGRTFDLVYASEVIEHVPDPQAFVRLLARWLAPDGTLVLTTPSADFVRCENASATLLAALAPGFHAFLLSPRALEVAVRGAGFAHVKVQSFGERQVVWASRRPLDVDDSLDGARTRYLRYIADRSRSGVDVRSPLWQGFAYRAVRDLLNAGDVGGAAVMAKRLCDAITDVYGEAALDPTVVVPRLAVARTLAEVGEIGPYFLPCLYFLLGAIAEHAARDAEKARNFYAGSHAATVAAVGRLGTIHFLEAVSLVWPARVAEARLLLARGAWRQASSLIIGLAQSTNHLEADHAFSLAAPALVEQALPPALDVLTDAGQRDLALEVAQSYCDYVTARYGPELCTVAGIERAFAAGAPLPGDPLLPVWAQGLRDAWRAGPASGDGAALREVVRLAGLVEPGSANVAKCRARAVRAQTLLAPAPAASITYDFSYTFKPPRG
ncbi:MAG: class I SAM-dependent methyltransferase [Casimicrobiaceae bacterium]